MLIHKVYTITIINKIFKTKLIFFPNSHFKSKSYIKIMKLGFSTSWTWIQLSIILCSEVSNFIFETRKRFSERKLDKENRKL